MRCHDWPGNARELRNYVERLVVLGEAEELGGSGPAPSADATLSLPYRRGRALAIERFNRDYVAAMLERHGGNVSAAARAAGVSRRYFQELKREG
jgi:DNA-binding NtrC family response regulator